MTTQPEPVCEPDTALSARERWYLDPWHTAVHFAVLNRGAGLVRGRFTHLSGTLAPGKDQLRDTEVEVTIEAMSVTTGVVTRDDHLRSGFLDVEHHPTIRFLGNRLTRTGPLHGELGGTLEFRGRPVDIELAVRWAGSAVDPFRDDARHLAFRATGRLTLTELGLAQDLLPGLRIPGLGDAVELTLDVVLLPYDPAPMLRDIPVG
ncbi:YceI family protein [Streptomyces sp. NPDC089424]|uniref:YceI family protein n=1 Tax=Streptomyces sp. NPDC089424 TaxID=3365917 RepID=UPI0037F14733